MTTKEKSLIQKEIVNSIPLKPQGRLLLAPRIGKTKIVIDIIKKNKPKSVLWVTPSIELANKDIPEEFEKWKASKFLPKFTATTWASLNKMKGHYEMIILDEDQFITENNISSLISKELFCNYMLGMTGTQTKHDTKKDLYISLKLPILYELSINSAVDIGILSNYSVKVLQVEMGMANTILAGTKDKPFFTSEKNQYNYLDKTVKEAISMGQGKSLKFKILARMRSIYNSPSKTTVAKLLMDKLKGRKLFFCSGIAQSETICENVFHSKTDLKKVKAFIEGTIDSIAMVNSGGIGWTYKNIDHLVMVQIDSDKNGLSSQKICRSLLEQKNYKAIIWVICLMGTNDEKWVTSTLENFDKSKIEYIKYKDFKI